MRDERVGHFAEGIEGRLLAMKFCFVARSFGLTVTAGRATPKQYSKDNLNHKAKQKGARRLHLVQHFPPNQLNLRCQPL